MVEITLTAANMGDVDETDFDLWTRFVTEHVDEALGLKIGQIDQHNFANGPDRDTIAGGTAEQRETVRTWLAVDGWNDFCGEAWETMRKEAKS